jgi:hypothetical protein
MGSSIIVGNMIGGRPSSPKTCTFITSDGKEIPAILVETKTIFDAETSDVREGKTFASDNGFGIGTTKFILEYSHSYAHIDITNGLCSGVFAGSSALSDSNFIEIPAYDENYTMKYYINGSWFEDESGTIPWTSSLV